MAATALGQIWARKLLPVPWFLCGPRRCASSSFKAADLQLEMTQEPHKKPGPGETLMFGKTFTDHMLMVEWTLEKGWGCPHIKPFQNLTLHPASSSLHYSIQLFEGLKAYKGGDQRVRLFRPWLNMDRMLRSTLRLCLPPFDKAELLECIRQLIQVDQDWVPGGAGTSLYVRPVLLGTEPSLGVGSISQALLFVILCPVGSYFPGGSVTPVSLLADPKYIRAWVGGVGDCKLGGNYGPTVFITAARKELKWGVPSAPRARDREYGYSRGAGSICSFSTYLGSVLRPGCMPGDTGNPDESEPSSALEGSTMQSDMSSDGRDPGCCDSSAMP
ncbi:branched-chain-amino-acid aminotransferase, mitochondrial isoform X2 [Tamandua tetradactyla]|uniref:branched-chain-amino-acid aminotransferase, mitochondrial isoform X2 n=1 Tax=Tamandua tetradactyla TaxID=48850 RepID=UPI004053E54C